MPKEVIGMEIVIGKTEKQPIYIQIYEQLKLEITPEFLARLEVATSTAKKYKSTHSYSLETYGFNKAHIYAELHFIFDEFGFEV